jgi:hypothetical protein
LFEFRLFQSTDTIAIEGAMSIGLWSNHEVRVLFLPP